MKPKNEYLIITPVRDEKKYFEKTFESVIEQSICPKSWAIVDDGSTDGTSELIDQLTSHYDWIKVVHRSNRGYRAAGNGVVEAFYDGYKEFENEYYNFIIKLDGDISFEKRYFERCFGYFNKNPKIGIGGGTVCSKKNGLLEIESKSDPPFHVRGATKIYRYECWRMIQPLYKAPGWDTIDEVKANMYGWLTQTFNDVKLIQHKATGDADGKWRNWIKNGLANYVTGYHPIFMFGKCLKRIIQIPFLVPSLGLFIGFCTGYLKRIPQVNDVDVIRYLREQQIRRILNKKSIYR